MNASVHAWFNGRIVEREYGAPSIASINFHLGTSVFDGFMAYWNVDHYYLHYAREHLERFKSGCEKMDLPFEWTADELLSGIEDLLRHERSETQYVRPIAYRRGPELWVTGSRDLPVDVSVFTVPTRANEGRAIACQISPIERISARAIPMQTKVSGAYVNSFHARRTAERAGFHDGIMLDRDGHVAEASAANVFLIKDEMLFTPPANPDIFPGITRKVILDIAARSGVDAVVRDLTRADLDSCDGAFLCSTLMEVCPVSRLQHRDLQTAESSTFRRVLREFRELTSQ